MSHLTDHDRRTLFSWWFLWSMNSWLSWVAIFRVPHVNAGLFESSGLRGSARQPGSFVRAVLRFIFGNAGLRVLSKRSEQVGGA